LGTCSSRDRGNNVDNTCRDCLALTLLAVYQHRRQDSKIDSTTVAGPEGYEPTVERCEVRSFGNAIAVKPGGRILGPRWQSQIPLCPLVGPAFRVQRPGEYILSQRFQKFAAAGSGAAARTLRALQGQFLCRRNARIPRDVDQGNGSKRDDRAHVRGDETDQGGNEDPRSFTASSPIRRSGTTLNFYKFWTEHLLGNNRGARSNQSASMQRVSRSKDSIEHCLRSWRSSIARRYEGCPPSVRWRPMWPMIGSCPNSTWDECDPKPRRS